MDKFKMKMQRLLRSFHIGSIGAIASGLCVIIVFVELGLLVSSGEVRNEISELIFSGINCIFYLMITKNFIKAKEENKLDLINYNLLILTIFDYIIPAIRMFLEGAFTGTLLAGMFYLLIPTSLLGILYFIFLTLENKRKGKHNLLLLTIIGGLILVLNFISSGFNITFGVEQFISTPSDVTTILLLVYYLLNGISLVLLGCVYFLYPYFIKRERTRGY